MLSAYPPDHSFQDTMNDLQIPGAAQPPVWRFITTSGLYGGKISIPIAKRITPRMKALPRKTRGMLPAEDDFPAR